MKKLSLLKYCLITTSLLFSLNSVAQTKQSNHQSNPLGLFAQLVGKWKIADQSLTKDGKWQAGNGADWNFYSILNGAAIQDDWISPSLSQPEPETGRQFGTNVRIYNAKKKQWEMAWASNTGQKIDTFTAVEKNGSIIMQGVFGGANTKITFYDIKTKRFSWKMERQTDKDTWLEIYRIEGTRVE